MTAKNVLQRFLAKVVVSDDRFQPPLSIVNAVDEGRLDSHVLLYWKAVVNELLGGPRPPPNRQRLFGAAIDYWRNKCAAHGYPLPKEFLEGLGGDGAQGKWSRKPGEQVEEWVKARLLSDNLIAEVGRSIAEWEMEVESLTRYLDDAKVRVEKHTENLAKAKTPAGVSQKKGWLDQAAAEVEKYSKDIKAAHDEIDKMQKALAKKPDTTEVAVEFEREFQFMMLVAKKALDQKGVLDSVKKAMERFESGLDIPDDSPFFAVPKTAGVLDAVGSALTKALNYLKGAWEMFMDWVDNIGKTADKLDKLMTSGGA